ncbi:uncharacterized protein LOC130809661 [Amaranthus tricolor]|uniref:uncharacterized protein LOC130809661 n=1 Tax=Amaranthus tricolor TaxID=29722 RepID=UPI002585CCB4|nr:uncharacterized protein LOC130809661 [Amaranthus tricolor]
MDTLSSPIPNLQVHKPPNPNHHYRRGNSAPLSHHLHTSAAKATATSSISTLHHKDTCTPLLSSSPQRRTSSPPRSSSPRAAAIHRSSASGYAAALLDITQSNGTVLKVEKDVRRLLRVVFSSKNAQVREFMSDVWVEEKAKGEVVKELIEKCKFERNLVGLVKMLINKGNSVELVKDVLEEFLCIFHQLIVGVSHHHGSTTSRLALQG